MSEDKDGYSEMKHSFLRELLVLQKLQDQPYFVKLLAVGKGEENSMYILSTKYTIFSMFNIKPDMTVWQRPSSGNIWVSEAQYSFAAVESALILLRNRPLSVKSIDHFQPMRYSTPCIITV